MMSLVSHVSVARRFQRSIRIDTDLYDPQALEGFICPKSSAEVLLSMARHIRETGQSAFTWTGPYGSGKSSLVVALGALLSGDRKLKKSASEAVGSDTARAIRSSLKTRSTDWKILPVVGRRDSAARVIGEAIEQAELTDSRGRTEWTDESVLSAITTSAKGKRGLVLFIDEMGKFLEAATQDGSDIYLFQQLAEKACRSGGRLIVIGVLHQSFEEYARRLSREMRDEWSKVQGRFIDLAINAAGEEQLELLSRAIESDHQVSRASSLSVAVAKELRRQRPSASAHLGKTLEACWPLHPLVALLLGPISRQRFGQNQRSVFGFLSSAEPHGLQDFLRQANEASLYELHELWDYLRANLEPSILASPDGHRWALAADAVERCEAIGDGELDLRLLKSIALLDLFKERSGLLPTYEVICRCAPDDLKKVLRKAIDRLGARSLIISRKFNSSYAIYAGSDFDIEKALEESLENIRAVDFGALRRSAGLQPVLAKRHYHHTGALRWFDVDIVPVSEVADRAGCYDAGNGTIGQFLLAIPTEGESEEQAHRECLAAARQRNDWDVTVGLSQRSWAVTELARELQALESVRHDSPELAGDNVARREVDARLAALQGRLETELHHSFDDALWHTRKDEPKRWRRAELNSLASDFAEKRFHKSPRIPNELLNRVKPSGSGAVGRNALLKRMVTQEGTPNLGINGFPAEGGLFSSLLEATGLYAEVEEGWRFVQPGPRAKDPYLIGPLWQAASNLLKKNTKRTVTVEEIYDVWRQPPYGVKDGLMPVLVVAFILSRRDTVALYRQGLFQAQFKDLDVEYLAKDAKDVQLRWMDLSDISKRMLSEMAEIVRTLDNENTLAGLAPIDVARGLIAIFERLHPWTQRTMRLSANAIRVRNLFKHARDPNKFLFDDIPSTFSGNADPKKDLKRIVASVSDGLQELVAAYPTMLSRFRDTMLAELQVPNTSQQSLKELQERAKNISQLTGDFRLDALAGRLAKVTGSEDDIEGIATLAANKPPRDWIDPDLDRALVAIAELAQLFIRAETFARVKGRSDKRHAMAVVVGMDGRPAPVHKEFDIADADRAAVDELIESVQETLDAADPNRRDVVLAALAELSAQYMRPAPNASSKIPKRKRGSAKKEAS